MCNSTLKTLSGSVEKNDFLELASLRYYPEHLVMDSLQLDNENVAEGQEGAIFCSR